MLVPDPSALAVLVLAFSPSPPPPGPTLAVEKMSSTYFCIVKQKSIACATQESGLHCQLTLFVQGTWVWPLRLLGDFSKSLKGHKKNNRGQTQIYFNVVAITVAGVILPPPWSPAAAGLGHMTWSWLLGDLWEFFTIELLNWLSPPYSAMELKSLHYRHVLYFWKPYDTRVSEMMFRRL